MRLEHPFVMMSLGKRVLLPESASLKTQREREGYVRNHIGTQYHLIGTYTMSEIVDDRLKVKVSEVWGLLMPVCFQDMWAVTLHRKNKNILLSMSEVA